MCQDRSDDRATKTDSEAVTKEMLCRTRWWTPARGSSRPPAAACSPAASSASTRKVADEADVPLSQLHYHFGSKDGLVLSLFEEENKRGSIARPASPRTPLWRLRAGLRLPGGRPRRRLRPGAAGDGRRRLVEPAGGRRRPRAAGGWYRLLAEVAREAEQKHGPLGPFTPDEVATLVFNAFLGSRLLLLGFDRQVMPVRSALRRIGLVIRALEEEPRHPHCCWIASLLGILCIRPGTAWPLRCGRPWRSPCSNEQPGTVLAVPRS